MDSYLLVPAALLVWNVNIPVTDFANLLGKPDGFGSSVLVRRVLLFVATEL